MSPKDQERMADLFLNSLIELRRRMQVSHDAGGTSIPDFAGTSMVFVLVDESSGDVTIVADGERSSNAVASLLNDSLIHANVSAAKGKSCTRKMVPS
ncbi:MAG TPA: hypothetical protein VIY48_17965 [Candidatus Paceibacterota bacterium]